MSGPICTRCGQPIASAPVPAAGGFQHARCPSRGMSTGAIVGLVGCGSVFLLVAMIAVFLAIWQFLSPDRPPTAALDAGPEPLSQTFASKNGLVTVHYPANFAASAPHEHVVLLQRHAAGAELVVAIDAIA